MQKTIRVLLAFTDSQMAALRERMGSSFKYICVWEPRPATHISGSTVKPPLGGYWVEMNIDTFAEIKDTLRVPIRVPAVLPCITTHFKRSPIVFFESGDFEKLRHFTHYQSLSLFFLDKIPSDAVARIDEMHAAIQETPQTHRHRAYFIPLHSVWRTALEGIPYTKVPTAAPIIQSPPERPKLRPSKEIYSFKSEDRPEGYSWHTFTWPPKNPNWILLPAVFFLGYSASKWL